VVKTKRIYDTPEESDGESFLVSRGWPPFRSCRPSACRHRTGSPHTIGLDHSALGGRTVRLESATPHSIRAELRRTPRRVKLSPPRGRLQRRRPSPSVAP